MFDFCTIKSQNCQWQRKGLENLEINLSDYALFQVTLHATMVMLDSQWFKLCLIKFESDIFVNTNSFELLVL